MAKKKNNFEIITEEEVYQKYFDEQIKDDTELINSLMALVEQEQHKDLNFAILNLGTLLQTISIYFELKTNEIEKILALEKDAIKQRKMTVIINEINEKINLKYGFDENIEVITKIFIYENNSYIKINKLLFLRLLFGTGFMDVSNMENI